MTTSNTAIKLVACAWLLLLTAIVLGGYACPRCDTQEDTMASEESTVCYQHLVQINVTKYESEPLGGTWLEPVRNESYQVTTGSWAISGITDEEGTIAIPMCSEKKYRVDISNRTLWLYPHESSYKVMLR
jgi:hypothetical protein